jgi:hypothetical protein
MDVSPLDLRIRFLRLDVPIFTAPETADALSEELDTFGAQSHD